ncbi:hypothetical protein GGS20DRAFT_566368 [Poronia punctata]|nr:hypothetical protein GGS20DRAFT_566368 [Poronia punctata]
MRATTLSLLFAASLALAQDEPPFVIIVESATGKRCAPYKNTTITFDYYSVYNNTNGDLDQVVGLYAASLTDSICVPYNADGSRTIDDNRGQTQSWFYIDEPLHVSPPVKVDHIICGQE